MTTRFLNYPILDPKAEGGFYFTSSMRTEQGVPLRSIQNKKTPSHNMMTFTLICYWMEFINS
ncbi:hypothetical protein PAECIP112173_00408 [Paenibacillus sp. JJ-100]|nr:hypothetical protein PAECIP112173_00408 [Paenibacillus sp. JJ-100]